MWGFGCAASSHWEGVGFEIIKKLVLTLKKLLQRHIKSKELYGILHLLNKEYLAIKNNQSNIGA